jgi:hypothetical protein
MVATDMTRPCVVAREPADATTSQAFVVCGTNILACQNLACPMCQHLQKRHLYGRMGWRDPVFLMAMMAPSWVRCFFFPSHMFRLMRRLLAMHLSPSLDSRQ